MVEYNVSLGGKTVLVTGAAGFIGSNLVKRLLNEFKSIKVVGLDSITDYYDVNIKYERLKEIDAHAKTGLSLRRTSLTRRLSMTFLKNTIFQLSSISPPRQGSVTPLPILTSTSRAT